MKFVLLFMTSRSGSSMVADIFVRHGCFWARNEEANPLVGGRKVRYRSFENQVVKSFNKQHFGTPLGEMVTYDDAQARSFKALVKHEYGGQDLCVWKGAVEFYPMWMAIADEIDVRPCIVWRPMDAVMDSLRAKRQGKVDEQKLVEITQARYDVMSQLAAQYAFPLIETDAIVKGDPSSLQLAFEYCELDYDQEVVDGTVKPEKWETER